MSFEFDEAALTRAVTEAANEAVQQMAAEAQPVFDALHRSHTGKPVADVVSALRAATVRLGWTLSSDDLTAYAEAISAGHRIVLKPEPS